LTLFDSPLVAEKISRIASIADRRRGSGVKEEMEGVGWDWNQVEREEGSRMEGVMRLMRREA